MDHADSVKIQENIEPGKCAIKKKKCQGQYAYMCGCMCHLRQRCECNENVRVCVMWLSLTRVCMRVHVVFVAMLRRGSVRCVCVHVVKRTQH